MKFYIETYGCTMNKGEGEEIAATLREMGFLAAKDLEMANLLILTSCIVIKGTENRMLRRLEEFSRGRGQLLLTGCMADVFSKEVKARFPGIWIVPTGKEEQIPTIRKLAFGLLEKTDQGPRESCQEAAGGVGSFPTFILPVSQGCLGSCSYCITRFARGKLKSYPQDELRRRFWKALVAGAREILVTSQDTGIYGRDIAFSLPKLLKELLGEKGSYRVRIGMMNPDSASVIQEGLVSCFKDPRLYRFLHIPVQSGSDVILEAMGRNYRSGDFRKLISGLRGNLDFTLSTDIIVGFPGESEGDFLESLELIRELEPDTVNITRFSERPGTRAANFPGKVHGWVTKDRSRRLTALVRELKQRKNQVFLGRDLEVLINKQSKSGLVQGRTSENKAVIIQEELELGTFQNVRIVEAHENYLLGELV